MYDDTEEPPVPNLPLLRKILAQIDAVPESWVQSTWGLVWNSLTGDIIADQRRQSGQARATCGTAYCIAGHVAVLTGWEPSGWSMGEASSYWMDEDGRERRVSVIARDALGLTNEEAEMLFHGDNSRSEVQLLAEIIASRAGEVL